MTRTSPENAGEGIATVIEVGVRVIAVAKTGGNTFWGNKTLVESKEEPNIVPVIVTTIPAAAEGGEMFVMVEVAKTVHVRLLLFTPFTRTTRGPVVAVWGSGTVI